MNQIQARTIKVDGLDVHYYTAGQGEPLVVIHGGGGDARTWWKNIVELSEKYTVYAPDLPGYGGSEPLNGDYYIPELSAFLGSFAGNLGLEKFYLVGHSMGGGVALDYALKSPQKIKKLVLVSSLCLGREIALWVRLMSFPALLRSIGALTITVLKSIKWLVEHLNPAEFIMPLSPASMTIGGNITTFKQQKLVLENRLAEIAVPTLLVWGAKDPIVPVRHAYRAARTIPDCRVKVFANRGHNVHRDELEEFSSTLTGFLG
jgi:4,5:9,10-diseco-3-hydroxy-5,9,17-trioxoandrosta-1(10),2-diene-4-oate hydrolase